MSVILEIDHKKHPSDVSHWNLALTDARLHQTVLHLSPTKSFITTECTSRAVGEQRQSLNGPTSSSRKAIGWRFPCMHYLLVPTPKWIFRGRGAFQDFHIYIKNIWKASVNKLGIRMCFIASWNASANCHIRGCSPGCREHMQIRHLCSHFICSYWFLHKRLSSSEPSKAIAEAHSKTIPVIKIIECHPGESRGNAHALKMKGRVKKKISTNRG